jgi:hypothetical protein
LTQIASAHRAAAACLSISHRAAEAALRTRIAQQRIFHILFIPTKSWFRKKSISRMRDSEELLERH